MFDGNHRSRRTVDLGGGGRSRRRGGNRRAGSSGNFLVARGVATGIQDRKAQVLESSRLQREERRQQQLRQQSALHIQRWTRGWSSRKHLQETLLSSLCTSSTTTALSVLLSITKPFSSAQRRGLLALSPPTKGMTRVAQERIVVAALQQIRPKTNKENMDVDGETEQLLDLLRSIIVEMMGHRQHTMLSFRAYRVLMETCQLWLSSTPLPSPTIDALWGWACQAAILTNTKPSLALLGITLLGYTSRNHDNYAVSFHHLTDPKYIGVSDGVTWCYQTLLPPMAELLFQQSGKDAAMRESASTMAQGCEDLLLIRSLDLYQQVSSERRNPHALLPLVQYVLSSRSPANSNAKKGVKADTISMLLALQIRGENVRSMVMEGKGIESTSASMVHDDDDDDDDDDFSGGYASTAASSQGKRHRGASSVVTRSTASRLSRQDIQTVPRFDRMYQSEFARQRRDALAGLTEKNLGSAKKDLLVNLVEHLGKDPSLWIEWGTAVLGQESASQNAYLMLLGWLLRGCSGLKTTNTSPFLSQLAFTRPFLEKLWRQVMVLLVNGSLKSSSSGKPSSDDISDETKFALTALTIFCDLFAHHLIALSDADFLRYYTTAAGISQQGAPIISAEHVIGRLRDVLYELYWNKPVLLKDMAAASSSNSVTAREVPALRARLMLSGTKLWNSLYERWCRLVRQTPFCDESIWWFPRLATRDDDGAVIGSRESLVAPDNEDDINADDDDPMEIDDDVVELESDALADTFRDPKMARLLTCIPQSLPFDRRVKLFTSLLSADKIKTQDETVDFQRAMVRMMRQQGAGTEEMMENIPSIGGREEVEIRRDVLYQDSLEQLNSMGSRLKHRVQVTFINQHGAQEAGIDGGGVFKEFLDDLIKKAFDPSEQEGNGEHGIPKLFSVTPLQTLAVNLDIMPSSIARRKEILRHYEFLGRVLGKALYESILVEPQFCLPFLNQLLGKQNSLEDLKNFDTEYYNNLVKLKTLSAKEIESLGLTFELTLGPTRTVPLIPGGSNIPVTKQNVIHYVFLVAHQRLNVECAAQTKAFLRGFRDLVPASWVRLFSAYELQKLVSGDDTVQGIDVESLKNAIQYSSGYHPSQPIIQWLWEVVEDMSAEQQKKFLRFMTSCSRQPLLGFHALDPVPCVQQVRIPDDVFTDNTREAVEKIVPLPTSSTCMNLLKLPNYRDKDLLRKKLLAAIESGAGFELS